jgi:hypothetical protein
MTVSLTEARRIIDGQSRVPLRDLACILEIGLEDMRKKAYLDKSPVPLSKGTARNAPRFAKADDVLAYVQVHGRADGDSQPDAEWLATGTDLTLLIDALRRDAETLRRIGGAVSGEDHLALLRQARRLERRAASLVLRTRSKGLR